MRVPKFIAEVSSNHAGDLNRCLEFIDCAADIGCDGVKFQLFEIDKLFAREILDVSPQHRKRRSWELPPEFIPHLAERARKRMLPFGCTPFHLEAVDLLAPHVDFLKIASYELVWNDLLRTCASTGKPLVLSTGMATIGEVDGAMGVLYESGCRHLTLLHCVSDYPARPEEANLAAILALRDLEKNYPGMRVAVGWSDHTVEPGVLQRAIHKFDAEMIEFHIDLDGEGDEFPVGHCWKPDQISHLIRNVRVALRSDGDGRKIPAGREKWERRWRADPLDGLRPLRNYRAGYKP